MVHINFNNKFLIALSDTHGRHRELSIQPCDFLIHCGDICIDGDDLQINDFFEWFSKTPAKYKLFISGNHDYPFVFEPDDALALVSENIILMENRTITLQGITFHGIRSQENLFELPRKQSSKINFLLTHVPPNSILDDGIGCSYLLKWVKMQQPDFHLFGHVHKFGQQSLTINETQFINACSFIKEKK